jgi:chaperonin cofactor prefoldin
MPSADDVQHMSSTIEQPRAHESAHVEQLKKHIETLEKQVAFLQREIEESRQARIAYQQPQKRGLLARLLGD